jgi:hypothetical protein
MKDQHQRTVGPGALADYLTELLARLRLLSCPMEIAAGIPAAVPRIKVAARLLPEIDPRDAAAGDELIRLAGVLAEFTAFLEQHPESLPAKLDRSLERLAHFLDKLLGLADAGVSGDDLVRHHGWRAIRASFRQAGSPLAVLDDLEEILADWREAWRGEELSAAHEQTLGRGWEQIKIWGDRLFEATVQRREPQIGLSDAGAGPPVLLLVDSRLLRTRLAANLVAAGVPVLEAVDSRGALELLLAGRGIRAVVCDDLEPTNHLRDLGALIAEREWADLPGRPDLVLALASSPDPRPSTVADKSVAAGVWGEPFAPVALKRILQRRTDP